MSTESASWKEGEIVLKLQNRQIVQLTVLNSDNELVMHSNLVYPRCTGPGIVHNFEMSLPPNHIRFNGERP